MVVRATLLLLALTLGCSKDPPAAAPDANAEIAAERPRLGEIRLAELTPEDVRPDGISESVGPIVRDALIADDTFERAPEDDPDACKAQITVGAVFIVNGKPVKSTEAGEARALIEGALYCPDGDAIETFKISTSDRRIFRRGDPLGPAASLRAAVERVAQLAAQAMYGQRVMRRADDAQILETLAKSDHPGLLMEAASEAGERRLTDAIDDLARHARHDNELVALRAGAALGLLGDGRDNVIEALVAMTSGHSEQRHVVAINALGDIGGAQAARYLKNISVGHPNATLRELARETLRRARDRP